MRFPACFVLAALALGFSGGCASTDDELAGSEAMTVDVDLAYATPEIRTGSKAWTTFAFQPAKDSSSFDGFVAMANATSDPEGTAPSHLVVFDRANGAAFVLRPKHSVGVDAEAQAADLADTRAETADVSRKLAMMLAGDPEDTSHFAALVDERNRCFIRAAGIALAALTVIRFTPWAVKTAAGLVELTKQPIGALLKQAWASPAVRKVLAIKAVDWAVEGWIFFADAAKPIRDELSHDWDQVVHAKCTLRDYGRPFIDL